MKPYQYPIVGVGIGVTGIFSTTRLPAHSDGEAADMELFVMGGDIESASDPLHKANPAIQQENGTVLVGETSPTGAPRVYTVGDTTAWRDEAQQERSNTESICGSLGFDLA